MQHPTGANPPKGEWTDGLGRRAGEVYYDRHGHRRVVTPPESHADDGTVKTGHAAVAAMVAEIDADQAKRASCTPAQREDAARYYKRLNVELDRRTAAKRARGWKLDEAFDFSSEWREASRAAAEHVNSRPPQDHAQPPVTAVARPRERRERHIARATSSGDSGGDPEPSEEGLCDCGCRPARPRRFCACGCRREITHRRADAKTFGASCRQRLKRANKRDACDPLEPRFCQCESGFFYRDAEGDAVCGSCGCWLAKIATAINGFDAYDALLRSNGTHVARRPIPRAWLDTQHAYRARKEASCLS